METKNTSKYQLPVLILFSIVAFFLWDTIFIYPVKLFVVFLHELAHGIAAIATGGSIEKIEIDAAIGGVCYTMGGFPFIVASAGYLGSIILGGIILVKASGSKSIRFLGFAISAIILAVTLVYIRNTFGFLFGLGFGIALLLITKFAPEIILEYFLKFIGIISCFYVIIDIKEDLFTTQYRGSDADYIASITAIPSIVWAVLWIIIALVSFYFFLKKSLKST